MNCSKVVIILLLLHGCLLKPISAQDLETTKKQDFPISISYNNHSWAFPLSSLFRLNPHYPGLTIGTEINYRLREKTKLFQTAELGGFLNNASGNAIYFNSDVGFRFTSKKGLLFDTGLGLGLLKSYHINDTYRQTDNGSYTLTKDKGITGLSINLFIGIGYDLSKTKNKNLSLFARYQWIAGTGYWSKLTIRPNGLLHVGIRRSLRNS